MRPITKLALAAAIAALPATAYALDKPPTAPGGGGSPGQGAPTQVPEPGMIGLFAAGIGGLYIGRRLGKRRRGE